MKDWKSVKGFPRFFIPLFLVVFAWAVVCAADSSPVNCDINGSGCTRSIGERNINLDIVPKPVKAMEELTFRVEVPGTEPPKPPYIDLGMPGMEMGPNRVELKKTGDSTYEGKGVIVRCPSGKTIWRARVTVPDTGSSDFVFDVAY